MHSLLSQYRVAFLGFVAAALFMGSQRAHALTPTYVDILSPTGGEVFVSGQNQIIRVQLHSRVASCEIRLSRDGGATFPEIAGTINNLGLLRKPIHDVPFPIVGPDSPQCVLKAIATLRVKGTAEDMTTVFTIGSPNLIPGSVTESILADGAVTSAKIQDGTIVAADIAANAITSANIMDGTVTSADIADGAVTSADIADNTIATADLADGSVTNPKIGDLAVTTSKLGDGAVTTAKILDGTILNADIANATITPAKLQQSDPGFVLVAQGIGNNVEYKQLTGDLNLGPTGLTTITAGAVGTAELIDFSVTRAKLERAGLGQLIVGQGPGTAMDFKTLGGDATLDLNASLVINNSAITTAKIADNAITTGKIQDGQVQTVDLADGAVTGIKAAPEIHLDNERKDVSFVGNTASTTFLSEPGSNATDSGAFLVGVFPEFTNSNVTNVQGVLKQFDTVLTNASKRFFPINTVDDGQALSFDSMGDTPVNLTGTNGLRVFTLDPGSGVDGIRQLTFTVRNGGLTATQIQNTVAGDGLSGGTPLDGAPGLPLAVNVAAPLSIVTDVVNISDDGIDGVKLADNITADTGTQEWSFPQGNGFFQFNFNGSSPGNQQVFRINRMGGTQYCSARLLRVSRSRNIFSALIFHSFFPADA
ncbi:MAG: hypothetical protein M5U26_20820 [Planctomycetota bacterium]|nr:hypothetical protein [Planctomycetota bacterium]